MRVSLYLYRDVFALSVNRKNSALVLALTALDPLHLSFDAGYGKVESGKIFKKLNIELEGLPDPDVVVEKFLARSRPRIVSLTELNEADIPKSKRGSRQVEDDDQQQLQYDSPGSAEMAEKEPSATKIPPQASKTAVKEEAEKPAETEPETEPELELESDFLTDTEGEPTENEGGSFEEEED